MIERDQLQYLKNILSLHNKHIDYNLLEKIIYTIKEEPDLEHNILDSFSTPQLNAKMNIVKHCDKLGLITDQTEITIFGCWFGSILVPALAPRVKKITAIDMDDRVIKIAKNKLFYNYENVNFISDDIFKDFRNEYEKTDLFINTSCEHMRPMSEWGPIGPKSLYFNSKFGVPVTRKVPWWTRMKKTAHFAFQSNDMFNIDTHINCVNNGDEFKTQLPTNTEVLVEDEINDERGTRFTLIGKIL